MNKLSKLILINALVFILLLGLIEGITRVLIPAQKINPVFNEPTLRTQGRPYVQEHPERGFAMVPGFNNELYNIQQDGFRYNGQQPEHALKTILLMGESTTFGWIVQDQHTYPYYLQQIMAVNTPGLKVINAGIPSYTSSQVLEYMREILQSNKVKPDLMLVNILWNDIWYSTITNWHSDMLIYQKPPLWLSFLTQHSRFFYALNMGFKPEQQLVNIENPKAMAYYLQNIDKMIQLAKEHGSEIAFVEAPVDGDHIPAQGLNEFHVRYTKDFLIATAKQYQQKQLKLLQQQQVKLISHRLGIQNLHQNRLFLDLLHPTPEGNKMMAEDVAKATYSLIN